MSETRKDNLSELLARLAGSPMSRRQALRLGLYGAAGLLGAAPAMRALEALAGPSVTSSTGGPLAAAATAAPATAATAGKAKAVIQIWLWGGASHHDTFDPKPEAGSDYTGPLDKPIETNVKGIRICELLPLLAKQADKYSLIRSMTHGVNGHETAAYMVQTGHAPGDRIVYPSVGAVVSLFKAHQAGYKGLIPPYIVLTEPQGRFSEAGFLGGKYKPFATGGDPSRTPFAVEGVVAEGITEARQKSRRELLARLNTLQRHTPDDPQLLAARQAEQQAYDLILGDAGKVFDLSQEPDEVRDRYGRNRLGQSCLAARRLIQQGVVYVTINARGWDTHKQHFQAMRRMLPELDQGLAALLADLSALGLLDSTVVWCCGEFGRTPKVQWEAPWNGGRSHYGKVFSALVAGGGFKGGQVVGASDARGVDVKDRPVQPADLIASLYRMLGIAPEALLPHPQGLEVAATPAPTDKLPSGGLLKEIM